ncbi:MAG: SH3 domain-containing protein [Acidobacteria bacterium]|nr:SH3 domain-containing protein [Acidobacteriota bacterium]MBV9474628.1 SH3 domain-containing protein [Acidobacteriota bacterium]
MKAFWIAVLVVAAALPLAGQEVEQEDEAEPSDAVVLATVNHDVRLHRSPNGVATSTLRANTDVTVLGFHGNGWVRVQSGDAIGWIDRHFLDSKTAGVQLTPKLFARPVAAAAAAAAACPSTLVQCQAFGCAGAESSHGLFNTAKHGPPTGKARVTTFALFSALQNAASDAVGEGADLSAADRQTIRHLKVSGSTIGEGQLVRVAGFIVGTPHPNTGESVNCSLKGPANNDFHITLAPHAGDDETSGIVVEMIPQDRLDAWTLDALQRVKKAKKRVLVEGGLLYDNIHRVNKNPKRLISGQPKRFSLWEVHPITQFYVCNQASCDPATVKQWTKLADLAP